MKGEIFALNAVIALLYMNSIKICICFIPKNGVSDIFVTEETFILIIISIIIIIDCVRQNLLE